MSEENNFRVVHVGEILTIDLEAMPGAGYMWELTPDSERIELVRQEVISTSKAVGGYATQRFSIVVRKPGSYSVNFLLKRTWEKNAVKTAEFSVQVI